MRIDELNGVFSEGAYCSLEDRSVRQSAAWQELFAREEWQHADAGHAGRCQLCGTAVDGRETVCRHCGAAWTEPNAKAVTKSQLMFGSASAAVSAVLGYGSAKLVANVLDGLFRETVSQGTWRDDFMAFVEQYLWVSDTLLFLLLCTYLYEKLGMRPQGTWTLPEDSERWKTASIPDIDGEEGRG